MGEKSGRGWTEVVPGLWAYEDSCVVYAIAGPEGHANEAVLINAGTGEWISSLDELPAEPRSLVCTHFFRDHSAGATAAAEIGIEIFAPYWEQEQFADPGGLFARRETHIIYDNIWDLFSPIESIPVARWLRDWESFSVAGIEFTVIPTPGQSPGAITLECAVNGARIAFCGEIVHSAGKILRIAPLQYNYNDFTGGIALVSSLRTVKARRIDCLASSTGGVTNGAENVGAALDALEVNVRAHLSHRPLHKELVDTIDDDPLIEISDHLYQSKHGSASTWFLISDSGKVMAMDYGYNDLCSTGASYPYPRNRRAMLHGIDALEARFGERGIDVVLVTHFHDDHVNGIPLLQRLFGTRCWAGENFASILEDPTTSRFPCTWPEPIDVEAKPLGVPFRWEEYEFTLYPMSGHTRFSTLIAFEADGKMAVATGDQYFFLDFGKSPSGPMMHNHVYRNGANLESFTESARLVETIRPDIILPGHGIAYRTTDEFYDRIREYEKDYRELHEAIMPLDGDAPHFDVDSRSGWLEPYRIRTDSARRLELRATIRNPLPCKASAVVRLIGPAGWRSEPAEATLPPRGEERIDLFIDPPAEARCRRQAIVVELIVDGKPYGQIAEALVTIGYERF